VTQPTAPQPALIREGDEAFSARYRAMASRDARFDGQFITGVTTTGIYCRPSCPAVTPKPQNVVFFRTAAAAHDAGLRACRRCLPDAVPGSPEWNLHDDLASRAMRLIADGTLEREDVPGLSRRLGYTPRHLTRILTRELGAGPLALARAHRAQTARLLLVSTSLPMTDVAFAAGFGSIRQFNETMAVVYERTPTQLRQLARRPRLEMSTSGAGDAVSTTDLSAITDLSAATDRLAAGDLVPTTVTLRLPVRPPFDGAGMFRFLADHAIAGVEIGTDTTFARRIRLPRSIATVEVRLDQTAAPDTPTVICTASLEHLGDLPTLVARVRRLLDLDADSRSGDRPGVEALGAREPRHPAPRLDQRSRDSDAHACRPAGVGGRGAHHARPHVR